jgi:hypothetical protein
MRIAQFNTSFTAEDAEATEKLAAKDTKETKYLATDFTVFLDADYAGYAVFLLFKCQP